MTVIILADWECVAVFWPVAVWHVGVARWPEVDTPRQAAVAVCHICVAIVQPVVADVLALRCLTVRIVVGVVVRACQGGGCLRRDEAIASVLHVASVDGVGVAAEWGCAFRKG